MDVTPLIAQGQQIIQSYSGGVFKVSGQLYDQSVFVMPDVTHIWSYDADEVNAFSVDDFHLLINQAEQVDVFLLGTGKHMAMLSSSLRAELRSAGISLDCMDTGAACRTYNVLMAEGRRVGCALMPYV